MVSKKNISVIKLGTDSEKTLKEYSYLFTQKFKAVFNENSFKL